MLPLTSSGTASGHSLNGMMLTFMRHPPIELKGERCIGQTNVELSPKGRAALIPLAEEGCRLRPSKILCSDLQRCRLLAEAIALRLGLLAEPDPVWREVNFGTWESRTWNDIQDKEPDLLRNWMANFDTVAPPAGESFESLQARVLAGIKSKLVGPKNEIALSPPTPAAPDTLQPFLPHYLLVTHAGVIRAAVSAFSGVSLRKAFELPVPFGSHTSFCRQGNHWIPIEVIAGSAPLSQECRP